MLGQEGGFQKRTNLGYLYGAEVFSGGVGDFTNNLKYASTVCLYAFLIRFHGKGKEYGIGLYSLPTVLISVSWPFSEEVQ